MKLIFRFLFVATTLACISLFADGITLNHGKGRIDVKIDGKLFTSYHYDGVPKPAL